VTPKEQEIVIKATRTPTKVRWPDWWVVTPWGWSGGFTARPTILGRRP